MYWFLVSVPYLGENPRYKLFWWGGGEGLKSYWDVSPLPSVALIELECPGGGSSLAQGLGQAGQLKTEVWFWSKNSMT